MSLRTTAAARQNEMKASMAVVAIKTRCALAVAAAGFIHTIRRRAAPEKKRPWTQSEPWPIGDVALPFTPAGLADGLGLGSVLWQVPIRPGVLGSPAPGASRRASAPMKVTKLS